MATYSDRDYSDDFHHPHHRARGVQWLGLALMAAMILAGLALLAAMGDPGRSMLVAPTAPAADQQPAQH